ncbi:MAG: rhodanese-like domain-containing protein [Myxococcales bacterium]|nr:rhodanese-like domain-containing protein [Myxococcales bacterium]
MFVGPRPVVPRGTRGTEPRWTEAPHHPDGGDPIEALTDGLEVEIPVPGSLLLDIREPGELAGGVAVGALCIPMDMVPHQLQRLPRDRAITVYCAAGARSWGVAHWLREQGYAGAVSLSSGIGGVGAVSVPAGGPGRSVVLPAGLVDGAWAPEARGEVIVQDGDVLRCRVRDAQGFWVERTLPAAS